MTSKSTNKFSPEVRARAVRMVRDHEKEHASRGATVVSIAAKIDRADRTLGEWVKKAGSTAAPAPAFRPRWLAPNRRKKRGSRHTGYFRCLVPGFDDALSPAGMEGCALGQVLHGSVCTTEVVRRAPGAGVATPTGQTARAAPPRHRRARVGVLISGAGSNMAALLYASRADTCPFELVLVAANEPGARGLGVAGAEGVATFALAHRGMPRAAHEAAIDAALGAARAEYVALAGYMRVLSAEFVARWEGRILNIHPSLLPKYPGLDTHARALAAGDARAGCSVHVVTSEIDAGPLLGQAEVAVLASDTPASLAARVLIAEHQLYPRCLAAFVTRETSPEWLLGEVRRRALALPEVDEGRSHGMPVFGIAKGKKFAWMSIDHHGDRRTALLVKISGGDEQAMLIENDPVRHFRPAYFGDGWIGIRLDLGDTDWDAIAAWLARSWRAAAPRKLTAPMDAADGF